MQAIYEYTSGDYYQSKNERIAQLEELHEEMNEVFMDLLILVIPINNPEDLTSVIGRLAPALKFDDAWDGVKTAGELLAVGRASGLYQIIPARESRSGSLQIVSLLTLNQETCKLIDKTKYLPPMLCPPNLITNNRMGGYLTFDKSVILGTGNHHEEEQCLDNINRFNQIALELDEKMLINHKEVPNKDLDTEDKRSNFEDMAKASRIVYAEIMSNGNKFWNEHKYDKRGRTYSSGYHVHIQSTGFKKSLINLHKKELITCCT